MRGQLVLQNVFVPLLQFDAGKRTLHVDADRTGFGAGFTVPKAEDDGVAIAEPGRWSSDEAISSTRI